MAMDWFKKGHRKHVPPLAGSYSKLPCQKQNMFAPRWLHYFQNSPGVKLINTDRFKLLIFGRNSLYTMAMTN